MERGVPAKTLILKLDSARDTSVLGVFAYLISEVSYLFIDGNG